MRNVTYWLSLIFIFTIPVETIVENPTLGSMSRVVGIVLAIFWIATVIHTGRVRKPILFHIVVLVFVCWNFISIFWSVNPSRTEEHLFTWLQIYLMIFILWDLYTTRECVLAGLQMYIIGCYAALGSTIFNYLLENNFYYGRYSSAGASPDDLGAVLALGIPMAWHLAVSASDHKTSRFLKWVNYAYMPAALVGIALSGTRLALLATIPGLIFCIASLTQIRSSSRVAIILLFICVAYLLLPLIPQESIQRLSTTMFELSGGDLNGRFELWSQGIDAFEEHPLLGVGSQMYRSVNDENKVAHNSFLSVLVELGLVGFFLYGLILAIVAFKILVQPTWDKRMWVAVLVSWMMIASTLTWEYRKPTWLLFSLIIAAAAVAVGTDKAPTRVGTNWVEAEVF